MRKTIKNVIFALLLLTVSVFAVLLLYMHFFAPGDENLSGEWTADVDMAEQATAMAFSWLQDIEGVSISMADMELYMQDLTIQVNLTMQQTADSGGIFECEVSPESYDACRRAAYEGLAAAFQDILAQRLQMAGYAGGTDTESIEALVNETFGMPMVSYLLSYGPKLLPSLEDLQAEYDGSGSYEVTENLLTRHFDDGQPVDTKTEHYIRKGAALVLSKESGASPLIYTLR